MRPHKSWYILSECNGIEQLDNTFSVHEGSNYELKPFLNLNVHQSGADFIEIIDLQDRYFRLYFISKETYIDWLIDLLYEERTTWSSVH